MKRALHLRKAVSDQPLAISGQPSAVSHISDKNVKATIEKADGTLVFTMTIPLPSREGGPTSNTGRAYYDILVAIQAWRERVAAENGLSPWEDCQGTAAVKQA